MDEIKFEIQLVFGKNTELNDELKNKIIAVIENDKLEEDDEDPVVSELFNNFGKFAKVEGNTIKAESSMSSTLDSMYVTSETIVKGGALAKAFRDIKIGLKIQYSTYDSVVVEDDALDGLGIGYHAGICQNGEYKTLWEDIVALTSFRWENDFIPSDEYYKNFAFPNLDE